MADEVDESVRAAFADMREKGYAEGYAAGLAAALERIQSLATEASARAQQSSPSMDVGIEKLDLPTRAYECLKRYDIHTIGGIYEMGAGHRSVLPVASWLRDIRGIGPKRISEIREALTELGYPDIGESKY
jgi:DNA-directed RNA polymerase alpha subunit